MPTPLLQCKDCGSAVSKSAVSCPQCGAIPKRKSSCLGLLVASILILFMIGVLGSIIGGMSSRLPRTLSATTLRPKPLPTSSTLSSPVLSPAPPPKPTNWYYNHSDYEMSNGRVHQAITESSNTVNFRFPYGGAQHGTLSLRTHPKYGKDVFLSIERGQFLVRSHEDSKALVRFDDGEPITYKVVGAEDHSTTMVFFKDYQEFVVRLQKAKRVRISVPVYQQGNPFFEFEVSDFDTSAYLEEKEKTN